MADYATQSKVRGTPGYNVPTTPRRRPITSSREQFHFTNTPHAHRPLVGHDCCNDVIKMAIDDVTPSWAAKLLANQMFAQYPSRGGATTTTQTTDGESRRQRNTHASHTGSTEASSTLSSSRKAARLLFTLGKRGVGSGDLQYPRAVAIDAETGDVYVADSGNRRIQRFTRYGLHLGAIVAPPNGSGENYFREPTGVAVPAFRSTIIVADRGVSKIMIFTKGPTCADHRLLTSFATLGQPYCVTCDTDDRIVLSTTSGCVEIYDAAAAAMMAEALSAARPDDRVECNTDCVKVECRLLKTFNTRSIHRNNRLPSALYISVSVARPETVAVSDPVTSTITWYTYEGKPVFEFKPSYSLTAVRESTEQHQAFVGAGIDVDAAGQLFVVDSLNGTVCVTNDRGIITRQLIQSSTTGQIQSVAIGPEGHFAVVEFEAGHGNGGSHCVRVYSHRDCQCHGERRK